LDSPVSLVARRFYLLLGEETEQVLVNRVSSIAAPLIQGLGQDAIAHEDKQQYEKRDNCSKTFYTHKRLVKR
jgi:hypothetical protein